MGKHYVFSTLTAGQDYTLYEVNPSGVNMVKAVVSIKGGANLPDKHLITPLGVVTEVTDDELAILNRIDDFKRHKELGFITVQERKDDVEAVVADMEQRDESAPLTPNDYAEGDGQAKPVVVESDEAQPSN